jgi:hypothetical protein
VIVVDNGSEDGTRSVVESFQRADPRVRVVVEPRIGLSHAKNAGIRDARGPLVLFTDDDVLVDDGWIQAYVDLFRRLPNSALVVAGGPVVAMPRDLEEWPRWVSAAAGSDLPSLDYGEHERTLRKGEWLWGANMAARGELLESMGGFSTELGRGAEDGTFEDVELVDRVRQQGGDVRYCPGARIRHRVDPSAARPHRILLTAFNRGCNSRVALEQGTYFRPSGRAPHDGLAAGLSLPARLFSLVGFALAFRLSRRPAAFDAARRAAWSAGWCMWTVTGESSSRRARALRAAVLALRGVALRLAD